MYRVTVLFCLVLLAIYEGANADFCSNFEEKEVDLYVVTSECCRGIYSQDLSKYENCKNDDDKCEEATCMLEVDGVMANGNINETAAVANAMLGKSKKLWNPVITKISSLCLTLSFLSDCRPMVYEPCMRGMAFVQCPKSEFTNSNDCKDVKKYIKSCILRM